MQTFNQFFSSGLMAYIQTIGLASVAIFATLGIKEAYTLFFRMVRYGRGLFTGPTVDASVQDAILQDLLKQRGIPTLFGWLHQDLNNWKDVDLVFNSDDKPDVTRLPKDWTVDGSIGMVKLGQLGVKRINGDPFVIKNVYAIFDEYDELRAVTYRQTRDGASGLFVKIVADIVAPV